MNIMIRATNWVGDAILALPAIRAVRQKFPDARISIVARPYVAEIYRDQSLCDELIPYDPKGAHRGWSGRANLISELRARKFDVALLLQNAFDAAWLAWRAQIPQRIGYARDGRRFLLTKPIAVPKPSEIPSHEKFYYLELLRRAGWISELPNDDHITLQVPDERRAKAAEISTKQPEPAPMSSASPSVQAPPTAPQSAGLPIALPNGPIVSSPKPMAT